MKFTYVSCFFALLLLSGVCNANPTTSADAAMAHDFTAPGSDNNNPYTTHLKPASVNGEISMDDLHVFATNGRKILAFKVGDLNGDGTPDALLVLDPPSTGNEKLGEGAGRSLLILIRNAQGQLQKASENDKIVPCAQCGGIAGDPFSYLRIGKESFTVVTEGGSREHWSNEYTFAYSLKHNAWLLSDVKREVTDQGTGKQKKIDLTTKDFGMIIFNDFDPSTLPQITLP
jgi:hypothetical protein